MPDVYVPVMCAPRQALQIVKTLDVHYKGKNITGGIEMTVEHAHEFFQNRKADRRSQVGDANWGTGLHPLDRAATTSSGGEAQRVKSL
jgi:excinuclease ABC subunit A